MVRITIDGREAQVPDGGTVLDAARAIGLEIPTLCHLEGFEPSSSCLLCIVRVNGGDRLVPSCATMAEEGMEVESETEEIREARKLALELLLGDHLGECLAPCHRICPLDLDIPRMLRRADADEYDEAVRDVRLALPFPGILGRVCAAKCEVGCRRRQIDDPVGIRNVEREVADRDRESGEPRLPEPAPDTGRTVAVVGGGPAGLSAAYFLRLAGHAVVVLESRDVLGGFLRTAYEEDVLPASVLDAELAFVTRLGAEVRCGVTVGEEPTFEALAAEHDAVLVTAAGAIGDEDRAGLFRAGDAVKRVSDPARAMASGRDAAAAIDAYLAGRPWEGPEREFSTLVARLTEPENELYVRGAEAESPASATGTRCLGCDCRATPTCLLKHWGERLGASPTRFKPKRRLFTQRLDHEFVVYEAGKCIACGICVAVTRAMGEDLGLTFIGRGFDVRVGVPFDAPLRSALRQAAEKVVEHCPTGALARLDRRQRKDPEESP